MTIILSSAALPLQTGMAAASVSSLVGMSSGLVITSLGNVVGTGAFSSAPGAAAGAASAGAILGAGVSSTALGSLAGGVAGALTSGAVNLCQALALGPIGNFVLGTNSNQATFDCWKPVIHDHSDGKTNGKLLKEILANPKILQAAFVGEDLILTNIWNEQFRIDVVKVDSQISLHASRV